MSPQFSTAKEILEEIRAEGALNANQQMARLVDKFVVAARAIDPRIENIWVGHDGDDFKRPFSILIERRDSVFRRRSGQ